MSKDGFEYEIEALFSHADPFGDEEAFAQAVSMRTARLRRTERLVHGTAAALGGGIALYELAQPRLWTGFYNWLNNVSVPLPNPQQWTAPDPMTWAVVASAGLLAAYVVYLLREA
jgi:hypothetical protein